MDIAWRFRIILGMAFVVIVFGDLLGYGGTKYEKKDRSIFSKIARISEQSDTTGCYYMQNSIHCGPEIFEMKIIEIVEKK